MLWITNIIIIVYYHEVKRNINEYYTKILREHNIQYESDLQLETRHREEAVKNRVQEIKISNRWNNEEYTYRYTFIETIFYLIYYFFMSLFPGYIEKKLDIFQREHNLLQAEKRIRDKQREFEAKKKAAEEEFKKMTEIPISQPQGEYTFGPEVNTMNEEPNKISSQNNLDIDPIIEDE